MNPVAMIVGLAVIWVAITGNFSALNLCVGLALGVAAAVILRNAFARPLALRRLVRIASLAVLFLRELLISAVRVAGVVLRPNLRDSLRPAIVAFPLSVTSDGEIALLANLITLTPGTLSVDVSEDRSVLYVHVLELGDRDQLIADIAGGFERKVQEVFA